MHDPEVTRRNNLRWSMSKQNRGLLTGHAKNDHPGPTTYPLGDPEVKHKKPLIFKMPREERKFDAAKYSMMHNELIVKGFL